MVSQRSLVELEQSLALPESMNSDMDATARNLYYLLAQGIRESLNALNTSRFLMAHCPWLQGHCRVKCTQRVLVQRITRKLFPQLPSVKPTKIHPR